MPDNIRFSNPDTMQKPPGYSHVVEVTGHDGLMAACRMTPTLRQLSTTERDHTSGVLDNPDYRSVSRHQSGCHCKCRDRPGRNTARLRAGQTGERTSDMTG
jgi:hypothetical protein